MKNNIIQVNGEDVIIESNVDKIEMFIYYSCIFKDGRYFVFSRFDGDVLRPITDYENTELVNQLIGILESVDY